MKTVKAKWVDPYRKASRFSLNRCLITDKPTRFVRMDYPQSGTDWDGSSFTNQQCEFVGHEDGWMYNGVIYSTLLRAVRQARKDFNR